jgi:hypothetical protein
MRAPGTAFASGVGRAREGGCAKPKWHAPASRLPGLLRAPPRLVPKADSVMTRRLVCRALRPARPAQSIRTCGRICQRCSHSMTLISNYRALLYPILPGQSLQHLARGAVRDRFLISSRAWRDRSCKQDFSQCANVGDFWRPCVQGAPGPRPFRRFSGKPSNESALCASVASRQCISTQVGCTHACPPDAAQSGSLFRCASS